MLCLKLKGREKTMPVKKKTPQIGKKYRHNVMAEVLGEEIESDEESASEWET
jgi:hypothetical protein